jgi:hypothetical protein
LEIATNSITLSQIQKDLIVRSNSIFDKMVALNDEKFFITFSNKTKYFIISFYIYISNYYLPVSRETIMWNLQNLQINKTINIDLKTVFTIDSFDDWLLVSGCDQNEEIKINFYSLVSLNIL